MTAQKERRIPIPSYNRCPTRACIPFHGHQLFQASYNQFFSRSNSLKIIPFLYMLRCDTSFQKRVILEGIRVAKVADRRKPPVRKHLVLGTIGISLLYKHTHANTTIQRMVPSVLFVDVLTVLNTHLSLSAYANGSVELIR